MSQKQTKQGWKPWSKRLLELDAWLDSALYESRFKFADTWEVISIFFRRFRVTGFRRIFFELASEGFTLGTVGAVLMLAFAMPAFEETKGNWAAQDDYAVTFLDRYGSEIGQRGIIQRDSVPVEEMPDHVIKAVLATEDRRFFEHYGIDFIGLSRAMAENVRARTIVQGGSTLTQQLAKNLFLTSDRTMERKIKEAFLALWLEANLSKQEILQLYLDRAYLGGGTFGIAAAADFYFDKRVQDLSIAEAAMIAGLFKAPARYAPHINLPAARARANVVLTNLVQSGFMSEGQVLSARLKPASAVDRGAVDTPDYYLDWAFEQVQLIAPKGATHSLIARTSLDPDLQHAVEESLEYHLRQYGKEYNAKEGAVVVMDTDGSVRAIVGGRDYGRSQFNRATRALRQPGSSFKPYVYATAMEAGFTPDYLISDAPISWGAWSPQNYSRGYAGKVSLATALIRSYNTVPVRLARDHLGLDPIIALTKKMGVETELNGHKTLVLGSSGMTVMDQATGYSVFANGGYAGTRHGIEQLSTHNGKVLYDFYRDAPPPVRVLSEQSVAYMNSMLVQVPESGTARRAAIKGVRSAGKTGTAQAYRDAWYVGYTGNYVGAVWLGNDDYSPTRAMTGGTLPAMIWQRFMTFAHQNTVLKPIPGISNPLPNGSQPAEMVWTGEDEPGQTRRTQRNMSFATTNALREMANQFKNAPAVQASAERETVSAL